jgi:hypothetical protein
MSEPTGSLTFLDAIAGLATRRSDDAIVISSFTYYCVAFGSSGLEAGRRWVRIRVTSKGEDREHRVASAGLASGSSERQW